MNIGLCIIVIIEEKTPTLCHNLLSFISLLLCSTCFGHEYIHHQEPATFLLYHHIGCVFLFRCVLEFRCGLLGWYPCRSLKLCCSMPHGYHPNPATPKLQHTSNKNTQPMWWYNRKVAGSWWWMYSCPKHVEHRRSEIKLNKLWHKVGLLFFNYIQNGLFL